MIKLTNLVVAAFLAVTHLAVAQDSRVVRVNTSDDVGIMATYYPVAAEKAPAVVLVHSMSQTRAEWADFAKVLQKTGVAAIAIDLRGHGESTRRITKDGPITLDYQQFTPRDFQDMQFDIDAAVSWLGEQTEIARRRIGVVGASVGANLVLRYATANEDLAAVVALSPGIVYRQIRTDDVITHIRTAPLRVVVSREDAFALQSSQRLISLRKEAGAPAADKELMYCTGNLHGTDMLKGVKRLPQMLADWLKETLTAHPATASTPPRR